MIKTAKISGPQIEAGAADHIYDTSFSFRSEWRVQPRKIRKIAITRYWSAIRSKPKTEYSTLAEALAARSSLARKRGKRFKRLRPYKSAGSWFLTKMRKGQVRDYAVCPR